MSCGEPIRPLCTRWHSLCFLHSYKPKTEATERTVSGFRAVQASGSISEPEITDVGGEHPHHSSPQIAFCCYAEVLRYLEGSFGSPHSGAVLLVGAPMTCSRYGRTIWQKVNRHPKHRTGRKPPIVTERVRVDRYVGSRIRLQRMSLGMTDEHLAEMIGVSAAEMEAL